MTAQRVVAGPEGTRFSEVVHVIETASTNADLLAAAAEGRPGGSVLVTDHQTAGRGRQSRVWHDEPGNAMLMSVLLRPAVEVATLMPLLAGLAVTDAVADVVESLDGVPPVALKWPNDVLAPGLDERKLAGILAEATTASASLAVVVGMGLNLRWGSPPPPALGRRAATLEELAGAPVDRWAVVSAVLRAIDRWLDRLAAGGRTEVLDAYRDRCLTLGRTVVMQRPTDVIEGVAVAIADDGALEIETEDGRVTVTAGDAHHL